MRLTALFIALFASLLWSFETVEDSKSRFVFHDYIAETTPVACEEGDFHLLPENAFYKEGSGMPYRSYRVAIPANAKPSVSVKDSIRVPFGKTWCNADSLKNGSVEVSSPKLRDGVWVVDIWVPLLQVAGSSVSIRKNFKVSVSFAGTPQNKHPGKRLLTQVLNPKGAASFATSTNTARVLRKAASSDLANMTWLARILVGDKDNGTTAEDGLYAVTYKQFYNACKEMARASDCEGIPVKKLRMYGAPQDTMTDVIWSSAETVPNRLFEIPLDIRDKDGTFNEGDTIFFVGYGTSMWKRFDLEDSTASSKMQYYYSSSPYSFYQYFQLGYTSSGTGSRVSTLSSPTSGSDVDVLRYLRVEKDALLRDTYFGYNGSWEEASGKEWFWIWNAPTETVQISSSTFANSRTSSLPHLNPSGDKLVTVSYVPHSFTMSIMPKFTFTVNGKDYSEYARLPMGNFVIEDVALKSSGNSYSMTLLPNGSVYDRFDGFSVAYSWNPALENDSAEWILPGKRNGRIRIPLSTSSHVQVMKFQDFEPVGILQVKNGYFYDSLSAGVDTRYLVYSTKNFRSPAKIEGVPAHISGTLSDISRISSKTEYIIIAPEAFQIPAVELAKFRSEGKAFRSYNTTVVLVEDIYRAYSGGSMDPVAIRNYLAYARSVCPNLTYAVLAGNGNFDYRGMHSGFKTNWMPPFEKEDAVVEDFFAALDSGERVLRGAYDLDLYIGRLPLSNVADFNAYNEKIQEHEQTSSADNSLWRNSIVVTADDAWTGSMVDGIDHTSPAEDLSRTLLNASTEEGYHLDIHKIYLLNYNSDAAGQKPEAASDLISRINQGSLFTIYFGHGSISDWAFEGLMKPSYISSLANESRYTILGSFSCTVGRFDMGNETSLSETFIQASKRGAIASIGATRETYGSYNRVFAKSVMTNAFFPTGGTLGRAYALAKGLTIQTSIKPESQRYNNARYALFGEPVVPMPNAQLKIKLDQQVDTIRALDSMTLSGTVSGISDGKIHFSILEQSYEKMLSQSPSDRDSVSVLYDGSMIFSEDAEVKDGKFSLNFITPRKISFGDKAAEIRIWANSNSTSSIGHALVSDIVISGTSAYADSIIANDTTAPSISIQSCLSPASGTSFAEGEMVTIASPACLQVTIEDSTAIDFREEADEGILFEVIGETVSTSPFHPWPYSEQSSKKAVARMTFAESKYPPGLYTFRVSAMDIVGNESSRYLRLNITDGLSEGLANVFTAPNPMKKKGTTFYFKDLAVGRSADVTIFIYNQNGRLVQRIAHAVSGVTTWDGRDFYGRKLANGLYHYIVVSKVPATDGAAAKMFRKKQKLVISR